MRRKTVGLFTPYLDVLGGGEKHILSILKVFDEAGYQVKIFWNTDLTLEIQNRLKLTFEHLVFEKDLRSMTFFEKAKHIAPLEWMLYVTDGSYFFSPAKKTAIFCMVPEKKLYNLSPINALKTANAIFIANSHFTATWLHKWHISSQVIYPYVSKEFFISEPRKRSPIVLSVGRFFKHLHTKKHPELIQTFLRFHSQNPEYVLVLAGGVKKEDESYVEELKKQFPQPYILFKTNIAFPLLMDLYKHAMMYWHFTGFGVDSLTNPEQVEHLGMTPLEAMASRTIPFCYNAGGPKEIIESGKNGFLFSSQDELLKQTSYFLSSPSLQSQMGHSAHQFAHRSFRYEAFAEHVKKIFHII